MKNTKANIIKVLIAMENTHIHLAESAEKFGNKEEYLNFLQISGAYYTARRMLESESYFNEIYNIYQRDIEEANK